jgi:hypothetical protein
MGGGGAGEVKMFKNMPHSSFKERLSHDLILTGDFRDKLSLQQAKILIVGLEKKFPINGNIKTFAEVKFYDSLHCNLVTGFSHQ